jgi:predicted secreted protein
MRINHRRLASCVAVVVVAASACSASDSTPWEQYSAAYNTERLSRVVSDQTQLVESYNTSYATFETCDQAYEAATTAEVEFQNLGGALLGDDAAEAAAYDRFLGVFLAGTEWLTQQECAGAGDFVRVG